LAEFVSAEEVPSGASGLKIQSRLNGQVMQDANTKDMVFGVAETICLISECMTLDPSDILVMGTPGEVGAARKPPVFMKPGDVCEIEIGRSACSNRSKRKTVSRSSSSSSEFLRTMIANGIREAGASQRVCSSQVDNTFLIRCTGTGGKRK
jgi:hypothetical protein